MLQTPPTEQKNPLTQLHLFFQVK
ncbi:uncharacterized protein METZ01_LOCUS436992 [marine metagenome]|uniref:Uncharacterized protein n=1 Tax=marine metagenome TaxID=408172 RepID=A0A382YNP8_9ZZZZ